MSKNELNTTAARLLAVKQQIARLEAEADTLTERLKTAMVEQGTEVLFGDGWKASWKNVNCCRFDSRAFRAENPSLASRYMKQTTVCRFNLA